MNEYFFYQMNSELRDRLGLSEIPFPIRKEKSIGLFQMGRLSVCKVLDELVLYLFEHPECRSIYAEAIGKLAWLEGLESGRQGFMEHSAHYLKLGLSFQPDNLSLHAEYAAALLSLGQKKDALDELEYLIGCADGGVEPMVWILAARLHQSFGNTGRADSLLEQLVLV